MLFLGFPGQTRLGLALLLNYSFISSPHSFLFGAKNFDVYLYRHVCGIGIGMDRHERQEPAAWQI